MDEKRVKIKKASRSSYWYARYIGKVFDVYDDRRDYIVKEDYDGGHSGGWRHVKKSDCQVVASVEREGETMKLEPIGGGGGECAAD